MNEFSLVCRLLGTLFNRPPSDPVLLPVLNMIKQGQLKAHWPLEQDALLTRLAEQCDSAVLMADYQQLFTDGAVAVHRSDYTGEPENDVRQFLSERGMTVPEAAADSFGALLLAASWLEDQSQEDEVSAQTALFADYLLPWSDSFLGKVEAHAHSGFYRTLAVLTREALAGLWEELAESQEDAGDTEECESEENDGGEDNN
ncbi:molecular chaperone [Morganella psychrotolerans]|uniref:TorD/DmsD family molecular chaperone n=1 Tax=Morganella psychrotolerans TaxID=368603 RepID=UPI0039AF7261